MPQQIIIIIVSIIQVLVVIVFVEQTNANDNQIKPSSRTLMAKIGGGHLIGDEGSAIYVSLLTTYFNANT